MIDYIAVRWPSGVHRILTREEYAALTAEEAAGTRVVFATRLDFLRSRRVGRGGAA